MREFSGHIFVMKAIMILIWIIGMLKQQKYKTKMVKWVVLALRTFQAHERNTNDFSLVW